MPDGPDAAVLLTATRGHRGWPTILEQSGPNGWQRLSRTNLPTHATPCRDARTTAYDLPYRFAIIGSRQGYTVRVVERDGRWTVRRSRY